MRIFFYSCTILLCVANCLCELVLKGKFTSTPTHSWMLMKKNYTVVILR